MDNVVVMEVLHTPANLPHEQTAVRLGEVEVICGDSLKQLAPVKILHHEDHFTRSLKRIDKSGKRRPIKPHSLTFYFLYINSPDDVGVRELFEDGDFFHHFFSLFFLPRLDVFGGVYPLCVLVLDLEHDTKLASAQLLLLLILLEVYLAPQQLQHTRLLL